MRQNVFILLILFLYSNLLSQEIGEHYIATGVAGNLEYGAEYVIKDFRTTKKGKEKIVLEHLTEHVTAEIKRDKLLIHCSKLITINAHKLIPVPVTGLRTIVLKASKSDNENFVNFGKFLAQNGFSYELKDNGLLLLKTTERSVRKDLKYKLNVSFSDSLIFINPIYQSLDYIATDSPKMNNAWHDWSYATLTTDLNYKAYQAFFSTLEKYDKEILYMINK